MFIHEMTDEECCRALQEAIVGRLGCAHDNQPYIVPTYFVLHGRCLYGFTTLGQKIEWMRANPQVCLEIDERTSHNQWRSVVVFGRFEELLNVPEHEDARVVAHNLLQQHPMWWEPAYLSDAHRDSPHSIEPVYYRIHIVRMTGHRATPNSDGLVPKDNSQAVERNGWMSSILRHIGMKN